MKERTQFIHDSFVDYKGKEHHFVICAYSKLLPKTFKEAEGIEFDADKDDRVETFAVSYADSYGCLDNYDKVVKSVSIGVAICNPEDEFNYVIGCKTAQAKDTINYLRNCSKQLVNNIMKFVNE